MYHYFFNVTVHVRRNNGTTQETKKFGFIDFERKLGVDITINEFIEKLIIESPEGSSIKDPNAQVVVNNISLMHTSGEEPDESVLERTPFANSLDNL